jgi:two-component sensor histidine kinase
MAPTTTLSSFALLAQCSRALSARSDEAIGPLLAAATVPQAKASLETHPIWVAEALHRAHVTLKLFLVLHRSRRQIDRATRALERRLAIDLARNIFALAPADSEKIEDCAAVLRDIVCNLVALFGPGVGQIDMETDISEVKLSRPRRRALVLLAHELVANAILHAFTGRRRGRIVVTLRRISPAAAVLCVMDDGIGIDNHDDNACGIATRLTTFLSSELYHRRTPSSLTSVEAIFKVEQIVSYHTGGVHLPCIPTTGPRMLKDHVAQAD